MARQLLVVALIFFAIVGMASASADVIAAATNDSSIPALGPSSDNDVIGNTEGSEDAASVGGPVSPGTFAVPNSPAPAPGASAASSLQVFPALGGAIFAASVGALIF